MDIAKKIVLDIRRLRESKSLTQEDLYILTNVHIGRMESKFPDIRVSTLFKILDALGVDLHEFADAMGFSASPGVVKYDDAIVVVKASLSRQGPSRRELTRAIVKAYNYNHGMSHSIPDDMPPEDLPNLIPLKIAENTIKRWLAT